MTIRQGDAQPFADFRHHFESYCAKSGDLAPTNAAKITHLKDSLAAYLRKALAVRRNLPDTDEKTFVKDAQDLANQQESQPEFINGKGSRTHWFASTGKPHQYAQ